MVCGMFVMLFMAAYRPHTKVFLKSEPVSAKAVDFEGEILEVHEGSLLMKPLKPMGGIKDILVYTGHINITHLTAGDLITIKYTGIISETSPPTIRATACYQILQ